MAPHGSPWPCHGSPWGLHGPPPGPHGVPWGGHGSPWGPMGSPWVPMGYPWGPSGPHGYPWAHGVPMGSHGVPWGPLGSLWGAMGWGGGGFAMISHDVGCGGGGGPLHIHVFASWPNPLKSPASLAVSGNKKDEPPPPPSKIGMHHFSNYTSETPTMHKSVNELHLLISQRLGTDWAAIPHRFLRVSSKIVTVNPPNEIVQFLWISWKIMWGPRPLGTLLGTLVPLGIP